jgi:hypothetical protein
MDISPGPVMATQGHLDECRHVATFEMLVERLGAIEVELRGQRRTSEYRDDMAEPGLLCGLLDPESERPFMLYKGYTGLARGLIYVTNGYQALFDDNGFDHELHRPTLAAAWGTDVAERAIAAQTDTTPGGSDLTLCTDFGIREPQKFVIHAKLAVVLRSGFPGVMELSSPDGIWLRLDQPTGVRDLLRLVRNMAVLVGSRPPDECTEPKHIRFLDANYGPKAERFLMYVSNMVGLPGKESEELQRLHAEWAGLHPNVKERIRREVDEKGSVVSDVMSRVHIAVLDNP